MKTILINEKMYKKLFTESMGVPNNTQNVAMEIVNEIIKNVDAMEDEINSLEYEYANEDEDDDTWGFYETESWEDEFYKELYVYTDRNYCIELYYDTNSSKKGDTDGDGTITINYYPIHKIINTYRERFTSNRLDVNAEEIINNEIKSYLYPIIIHELTHDTDRSGGMQDYSWISNYHRLNEEDLREVLYLFDEKEMNARIASSAAIMESAMGDLFIDDSFSSGREFIDFVNEWVIGEGEDELHIRHMGTLVSLISHGKTFKDRKYLNRFSKGEKPYCLAYDLFKNDSRLKTNRNLKRLFHQNFNAGVDFVVNFYKKCLERYRSRIIRACWYVYQQKTYAKNEDN